jgi:hypothetical protein
LDQVETVLTLAATARATLVALCATVLFFFIYRFFLAPLECAYRKAYRSSLKNRLKLEYCVSLFHNRGWWVPV